ncbi:hypothetical protein GGR51DRAFT_38071 [Nemania sp. FL0031]|nr:hypothetical protein GGR51DRAFT_38071 [Nemania sp. FL0031]
MSTTMKQRTYFLCPGFTYGPESISLGYIIPSPSKPSIALNRGANFETPLVFSCKTQDDVTITRRHPRHPKFGLMQNFLRLNDFRVDGTDAMEYNDRFHFTTIETVYYDPSPEDIRKAVESNGVKIFLASTLFRKPLYLVTGLKIARGVRSRCPPLKHFSRRSKAGITVPSVPNERSGVELCASSSKSEGFTSHPDFIVAFQLRKLLVRRSIAPNIGYSSRAILDGKEDGEDESEEESDFDSEFNSEDDGEDESKDNTFEIDEIPAGVDDLPNLVSEEIFYGPEDRTLMLYSADWC